MLCEHCNKDVDIDNMSTNTMCDDCFDKMMDKEDTDLEIYDSQNKKCYVCGLDMKYWSILDNKAICSDCRKNN